MGHDGGDTRRDARDPVRHTDVDDATALLLVFRARAFARTGWRHRALLERAEVNLATNRRAAARARRSPR